MSNVPIRNKMINVLTNFYVLEKYREKSYLSHLKKSVYKPLGRTRNI